MATCLLTLYVKTEIDPLRNMVIENIPSYLSRKTRKEFTIQFFRPVLETSITLDFSNSIMESQDALYKYDRFDYQYASVTYTEDGKTFYYFITNFEWRSRNTIKLFLKLDVLNTYQTSFINSFTDRTTIIREHRDRFDKESLEWNGEEANASRIIDKESEGFDLPKYIFSLTSGNSAEYLNGLHSMALNDNKIIGYDNLNWYLIYQNETYEPGSKDERSPVKVTCCSDEDLLLHVGSINYGSKTFDQIRPDSTSNFSSFVVYFYNSYVKDYATILELTRDNVSKTYTINTDKQVIAISKGGGGQTQCYVDEFIYNDNGELVTHNKLGYYWPNNIKVLACNRIHYANSGVNIPKERKVILNLPSQKVKAGYEGNIYLHNINNIDRTDPKLIKIIKLPYAPDNMSMVRGGELSFSHDKWFINEDDYLEAYNFTTEFVNNNIYNFGFTNYYLVDFYPNPRASRIGVIMESKLLNSEFTSCKLVYGDTEYNMNLELLEFVYPDYNFNISFKATNTINSNFLFKLSNLENLSPLDFPNYLMVKTNNDEMLLNSAYLNYVNNGYNYDKKHNKIDLGTSIFGSAVGIVGQSVALATGVATGGASAVLGAKFTTGIASDIVGTFTNQIKAEDNIKRGLIDYNNTKVNISGSDDIDLRTTIDKNKLWYIVSTIRPEIQKKLDDLFYYTGYSHPYQEKPDLTSRYWFNFIQCNPEFDSTALSTIKPEILAEITERLKIGVTVFHEHEGLYDILQHKENYETWLIK